MDIDQITNAKVKLEAKAKKWLGYLDSVPDAETKQKEMTRLLMETFLEGANNYYALSWASWVASASRAGSST